MILLYGFPFDVRVYDEVAPASSGARVIVPYLRGFGLNRFVSGSAMRRAQECVAKMGGKQFVC